MDTKKNSLMVCLRLFIPHFEFKCENRRERNEIKKEMDQRKLIKTKVKRNKTVNRKKENRIEQK